MTLRRIFGTILVIIVLIIVGVVAFIRGAATKIVPEAIAYEQIDPGTLSSVRSLASLTTVEMVEYTTVQKGTDYGWLDWAAGDHIEMFAVARIGAGIDLSALTTDSFTVDETTGHVTVSLPAAEITYVAIDNEATRVYDRDTGLFTKGDPQLESAARLVAEEVLVDSALGHGLLDRARASAEEVISGFLTSLGYPTVTVTGG